MYNVRFEKLSFDLSDTYTKQAVDLIYNEVFTCQQPDLPTAAKLLASDGVRLYGLIEPVQRLVAVGSLMPNKEEFGEDPSEIWVNELAVLPSHRGQGLGKLMLTNLEQTALDDFGVSSVALCPKNKKGVDVVPFYECMGYIARSEAPFTMMKSLNAEDKS